MWDQSTRHVMFTTMNEKDPCTLELSRIGFGPLSIPPRKSFKVSGFVVRCVAELSAICLSALEYVEMIEICGQSSLMEATFRASYVTDVEMFAALRETVVV